MKRVQGICYCIVAAIFAVVPMSCKKEPLPVYPAPVTKLDMLTYSSWLLTAQGFDINADGTIDLDETPPFSCVLDNLTYFYRNNSGSFDQGATRCNPNHDQYRKFD